MVSSRVLSKLRGGDLVKVVGISRVTDPWLTEVAGRIGYDCVWFDMEHRDHPYAAIAPMSLACRLTGMDLMVRILKTGYSSPMRVLEHGANGIMVPHCMSAQEAQQWVDWVRFPPVGKRGFDGAGADADWSFAGPHEHLRHANAETFLALQIEDREAVDCIDEIAAVAGYDILFIGPADLSISLGVPFEFSHPLMEKAFDKVANACAKHGKFWGSTSGSPEQAQRIVDRGGRFFSAGGDHGSLVNGLKSSFESYKAVQVKP